MKKKALLLAKRCYLPMIRKVRTHCSTEMIWSCFSTLDLDSQNKSCRAERMLDPVPKEKKKEIKLHLHTEQRFSFQRNGFKSMFVQFVFTTRLVKGYYFPWSFGIPEGEGLLSANIQLFGGCWRGLMGNVSSHRSKPLFT